MDSLKLLILATVIAALPVASALAGDLDDGIALDDPVADDLQKDVNVQFIVAHALGRAHRKDAQIESETDGAGNINFAPGAKIGNNVIILNNSKNKDVEIVEQ